MRQSFLDCARGLGMMLVVFGHAARGLRDAHILPSNYWFSQIDFTLYTFHMPLFFLLSGLHVWPSVEKGAGKFLQSKFLTIVVPYFVWSVIQGGVQIIMAGSTNHALSLSDWPWLFYKPIGQFWFLYALMIWQLIALGCGECRPALFLIAVVAFTVGSALPESFASTTMKMGIFFAAGTFLGSELERRIAYLLHAGIFLFCCLAFLLAGYAASRVAPFYSWQALPAAILGITLTLIACHWINRSALAAPFVNSGRRSMHIYVLHIMAVSGVRIALVKVGIGNPYFLLLVCTAAGIVLPLGVSPFLTKATRLFAGNRSVAHS